MYSTRTNIEKIIILQMNKIAVSLLIYHYLKIDENNVIKKNFFLIVSKILAICSRLAIRF